jgi:hypothetical protein
MSTYQPPGAPSPDGTPGYSQPQDPWEGAYDPGVAAMPTDPIHQGGPAYPSYPGGYGDVWSQQTAPHQGQYAYVPPPKKGRGGTVIVIVLALVVLGGGAGAAAWYVASHRTRPLANPTPTASVSPSDGPTDPHTITVGDCIVNKGTVAEPKIYTSPCSTPHSYKVIKVATGIGIPEGPNGTFDDTTTSVAVCQGTGYQSWYGYKDAVDPNRDVFFCMTNN